MVSSTINTWAVFRFALGYPDERHLERFADLCQTVPVRALVMTESRQISPYSVDRTYIMIGHLLTCD